MRKKLAALLRDCEKKFQDHPAFAFCDEEEVRQVSFREFLEDVENRRAVYREIGRRESDCGPGTPTGGSSRQLPCCWRGRRWCCWTQT